MTPVMKYWLVNNHQNKPGQKNMKKKEEED